MDTFTTAELQGRQKFDNMMKKRLLLGRARIEYSTVEDKESYDWMMTAGTKVYIGEIKNVDRDYHQYPNFMLDVNKVNYLKERAKREGITPYLVAFFRDYTIIWNLTDIPVDERVKPVACTPTCKGVYKKGGKIKDETFLFIEEAVWKRKTS